jgi:hypothetical protein
MLSLLSRYKYTGCILIIDTPTTDQAAAHCRSLSGRQPNSAAVCLEEKGKPAAVLAASHVANLILELTGRRAVQQEASAN